MRKKIIAANWKMHLSLGEAIHLMGSVLQKMGAMDGNESVILFSPSLYIFELNKVLQKSGLCSIGSHLDLKKHEKFILGAQNLYPGVYGAFTGEVSASMLSSVGVKYVLVGHSERRTIFHESDKLIAQKVDSALTEDLCVIFCCGEDRSSRDSGSFLDIIKEQIHDGLFNLSIESIANVVIAYEPVWAIGSGATPTAEQIEEVCVHIRSVIALKFGGEVAGNLSILYGGSCNSQNAKLFYNIPGIDGLLVGGASLACDSFCGILENICTE